jgi:hypothetical protein
MEGGKSNPSMVQLVGGLLHRFKPAANKNKRNDDSAYGAPKEKMDRNARSGHIIAKRSQLLRLNLVFVKTNEHSSRESKAKTPR